MADENGIQDSLTDAALDALILQQYPYPIAVNYKRLLETTDWQKRTLLLIELFEWGLRTVTLSLLSQYLIRDIHEVNDEKFNQKLLENFRKATLGTWNDFLFTALQVYEGKQNLFFTPELYELYWDTSRSPERKRKGTRAPFDRLVALRNDYVHRPVPFKEAEWRKLGEEIQTILRGILGKFSFICNYELIRVVRHIEGETYLYEKYVGQSITQEQGVLINKRGNDKQSLEMEWFYLRRGDQQVMEMHPLLVLWTNNDDAVLEEGEDQDVAYYDHLKENVVIYVTLVIRQAPYENRTTLLREVRDIISYNLEHIKMRTEEARKKPLTWGNLRDTARMLTENQMGSVALKYDRDVYFQRDETVAHFEDFLASDKSCFVLTGKSGVGKSNFILSLAEKYSDSDKYGDRLCYLMYDGARLETSQSMMSTIAAGLDNAIDLRLKSPEEILTALDRRGIMAGRQLLLVFDAINEHVDPKGVLQLIDKLVGETLYPWLKVVITSRPQAWRTMKRGLHLSEHRYYRDVVSEEVGVELPEFRTRSEESPGQDLDIRLNLFRRDELKEVYGKYEDVYDLKTAYEHVLPEIRESLRDPLVLRLVADIYRHREIGRQVRVGEIYQKYVERLVETGRLEKKDIVLLEQEIVPLMLSKDSVSNKVYSGQIDTAVTADGKPLWELIESEDRLSDGTTVNRGFARLSDAEILIRQGTRLSYEISFKYERFYDYYAGKRLQQLIADEPDEAQQAAYENWIIATRTYPFLWGAVQNAVQSVFQPDKFSMIVNLCETDEQVIKEMMVAALTAYGRDDAKSTLEYLQHLMALGKDALSWRQRLLPFTNIETTQAIANAKKTAVEVAANLGQIDILLQSLLDRDTNVRNFATLQTVTLWHQDRDERGSSTDKNRGFTLIRRLQDHIRPGRLPNLQATESLLNMALYIALTNFNAMRTGEESGLAAELRQISRDGLEKLLYIGDQGNIGFLIRNVIRGWVLSAMVNWVNRAVADPEEGRMTFNPANIETFLRRPRVQKEVMHVITRCIDSSNKTALDQLEENLSIIFDLNEGSTDYALQFALIAQWDNNSQRVMQILTSIFEEGMTRPRPDYTTYVPLNVLATMLINRPGTEYLESTFMDYWQRLTEKADGRVFFSGNEHTRFQAASYFEVQYKLHQHIDVSLPCQIAEAAVAKNDIPLLTAIIFEAGDIGRRREYLGPALMMTEKLLLCPEPKIQYRLIDMLARLRRYYPDEIDDFMVEYNLSDALQRKVKTTEVRGAVSNTLLLGAGSRFIVDAVSYSPGLQQVAIWILNKTVEFDSFDKWMNPTLRRLINLIYDGEVFALSD